MSNVQTPSGSFPAADLESRMAALEAHLEEKLGAAVEGAKAHGGAPAESLAALEKLERETQALSQAADQWRQHSESPAGQMLASVLGRVASSVGAIADRLAERIRGETGLFKTPAPPGAPPTPPVKPAKPPKAVKPAKAHAAHKTKAPKTYTVKKGDTLWAIAERSHIPLSRLIRANKHIANPDLIYPGDRIKIPGKAAESGHAHGSHGRAHAGGADGAHRPKPSKVSKGPGASGAHPAVQAGQVGGFRPGRGNPSPTPPAEGSDGPGRAAPKGSVASKVLRFRDEIDAAARKYHVPASLIAATIEHESGGNPNARSFDGGHGKGLMQIDDRFHSFARGSRVFDPAANIDYGAKLIAANLHAFPGNLAAGIAAFNAGVGGVQSALSHGRPPSSATYAKGYVSKIEASMRKYEKYL